MMTRRQIVALGGVLVAAACAAAALIVALRPGRPQPPAPTGVKDPNAGQREGFVGSASCRDCHERFYKLWAPSHHGLAMQTFTSALAKSSLTEQKVAIAIGEYRFRADISGEKAYVHEEGPGGKKQYPIAHAMGGKNVYYFLTPLERGRLQVLPVAYDVGEKKWINTTASMVRHVADRSVHWTDPLLTFNTSCHGCHVSQLATNYDAKTDSYHTTWAEPGINCETCHGPAGEHVRVCKEAPEGQTPKDLKILSYKSLTIEQTNATCAPCHAKGRPLSTSFKPGDRFFDHYDLVTLEHPDFYPDGRDLGENYTYTGWRMSPCVKAGKLSCTHCHTSSGRYRFKGEKTNQACAPCHQARVDDAVAHHRHPVGKAGSRCVDCHMPTTTFARMTRSDHSMHPPTPSATIAFKSPNACNICHTDKDAKWADKLVREWHHNDYQAPVLHWAGLIEAGRKRKWTRLPEMLSYLAQKGRDDVVAASLIRLLANCHDARVEGALLKVLGDASPLVRAAAIEALATRDGYDVRDRLLAATGDEYRVVRLRAASALAAVPRASLPGKQRQALKTATEEYLRSLRNRLDLWTSHFNLGNYHMSRGDLRQAIDAFDRASKLRPDAVLPLVNASITHARLRQAAQAERKLRAALEIEPKSAAAHFNLGLVLAEQQKLAEAEQALRAALDNDPSLAQAAYNLGIVVARTRPKEAIEFCAKAHALRPANAKYAYTLAFYLAQQGRMAEARPVLQGLINRRPTTADPYLLLADIHIRQREIGAARGVLRQALTNDRLSSRDRVLLRARLQALSRP